MSINLSSDCHGEGRSHLRLAGKNDRAGPQIAPVSDRARSMTAGLQRLNGRFGAGQETLPISADRAGLRPSAQHDRRSPTS